MANPFGDEPVNSVNPFGDSPVSEGVPASQPEIIEPERKTDLPLFSSEDIMAGISEGGLSETARNAALELQKRGRIGEGTIPYLESLKQSRLKEDVASIDKPTSPPGINLWEMATGEKRKTELTEKLPEFRETAPVQEPSLSGQDLGLTAGLMFSLSDQDAMDVIKEAIPDAEFIKDEKGNVIVEVDGQLSVLNKPGFSKQDAVKAVTQFLSFIPAGRFAQLGKGLLQKFGLGAAAAGRTEAIIEDIGKETGVTAPRDTGRLVAATVMGGLSEAVMPAKRAAQRLRQEGKVQTIRKEFEDVAESIAKSEEAEKATGITLAYPQKTAIPSQLEEMSFVGQLPPGSKRSLEFIGEQNKQAENAVTNILNSIAPPESITKGAKEFRTASQRALDKQRLIRQEKTSPIYEKAFENIEPINTKSIKTTIAEDLEILPEGGEMSKTLKKVNELIGDEASLEKLHNSKLEIDQMLNKFGDGSLGNTTKRKVTKIKNELTELLESESDEYAKAMKEFEDLSGPVNEIQDSIIGKVADLDGVQLKTASNKIFDPAETNPEVVKQAKKVISDVDPEAWNKLLRVELEKRLGKMITDISESGTGTIENIPGQIHRAFFKPVKQKRVLYAALDGDQKKNMELFELALKRASLGRPGGSQTATREEIKKRLEGGFFKGLRNLISSPVATITGAGDQAMFDSRVRKLADKLFSPDFNIDMKEIRQKHKNVESAINATIQLLDNIGTKEE